MMQKMKERWGVSSTRRFIVIMIVFSLAGSSIMFCRQPVYNVLHLSAESSLWLKIPVAIAIYQVMLLAWGAALGEFQFFWEKEKKMGRRLMRLFVPSR